MRSIPCILGMAALLLAAAGCGTNDEGGGTGGAGGRLVGEGGSPGTGGNGSGGAPGGNPGGYECEIRHLPPLEGCEPSDGPLPEEGTWFFRLEDWEGANPHDVFIGYSRDDTEAKIVLHMEGQAVELDGQVLEDRIVVAPFRMRSEDGCHYLNLDFEGLEIRQVPGGICATGQGMVTGIDTDVEADCRMNFVRTAWPAPLPSIALDSVAPVMPASTWKLRASEPLVMEAARFELDGRLVDAGELPEGLVREFVLWPEEPLPWGEEVTVSVDYRRVTGSTGTATTTVKVAPAPASATFDPNLTSLDGLAAAGVLVVDETLQIEDITGFRIGLEASVPDDEGAVLRLEIREGDTDFSSLVRVIVQSGDTRLVESFSFFGSRNEADMDLGALRGQAVSIAIEQDALDEAPYCHMGGAFMGILSSLELLP